MTTAPPAPSAGEGLPSLDTAHLAMPALARLSAAPHVSHPPRFLVLYGSLRARSLSRALTGAAAGSSRPSRPLPGLAEGWRTLARRRLESGAVEDWSARLIGAAPARANSSL